MDRSLAQQLTTDWKEGFSGELASNDLIEVKWGILRAIGILNKQDTTIGRLKLALGASVIALLCLSAYTATKESEEPTKTKELKYQLPSALTYAPYQLPSAKKVKKVATWVPWKEWSYVYSPFTGWLIDVRLSWEGASLFCPYSGFPLSIPKATDEQFRKWRESWDSEFPDDL